MLLIILAITSALSQDLSGVGHGNAKTPDDKEVLFVCHFEKNEEKIKNYDTKKCI